jgi:hypothetical protein
MHRHGHLATINGGQVWVIRNDDYEVISAKVVYVEEGRNIALGRDIIAEPLDSSDGNPRDDGSSGGPDAV